MSVFFSALITIFIMFVWGLVGSVINKCLDGDDDSRVAIVMMWPVLASVIVFLSPILFGVWLSERIIKRLTSR